MMPSFCSIWLCICLLGGEPVSPEELKRAITALEKSLTPPASLEVNFRTHYESMPGEPVVEIPFPDHANIWLYKADRHFSSRALATQPADLRGQVVYDGKTTREWVYDYKDGKLANVWIRTESPRWELLGHNELGNVLGFVLYDPKWRLGLYFKEAQTKRTLTASRTESGLEIQLGSHEINRATNDVSVTLDPTHDYRMTSWRLILRPPGRSEKYVWLYVTDEFQQVDDEATHQKVWFPLRAHTETPAQKIEIKVDSVRINPVIPDSRFAHQQPPLGTVMQQSLDPARPPRRWLVGGEAEEKKLRDQHEDAIRQEHARLDREGVTFNASPPQNPTGRYLAIVAGLMWLFAGILWVFSRKREKEKS